MLLLAGCGKVDGILYSADGLDGSPIAVLDHPVSEENLKVIFPESDITLEKKLM